MSTEQTESTTRLPAVAGPAQEQQPAEDAGKSGGQPEWGAVPPPATPRSKWTAKRIVIAAVVAVGIAAAGGVAIYAASGSVDNSQAGGPGGGRMIMGGPMAGIQDLQHGEFQTGEVTALSADSITVRSEDDYEQTYAINDDTQVADGVAQGDEVTVIATTESDKATATSVIEFGTMPNGGQGNRQNGGNNQQPPNGKPPNGNN